MYNPRTVVSSDSEDWSDSSSSSVETDEPELIWHVRWERWHQAMAQAASHPREAQYIDCDGFTALHEACWCNPPVNVVSSLVNAFFNATSIKDSCGRCPLHVASFNSSPEVVQLLLEANIAVVPTKNDFNCTPLEYLCLAWNQRINKALKTSFPAGADPVYLLDQDVELKRIWSNASLLVKASYHSTTAEFLREGKKFRMVHACSAMECCPSNLLRLAIRVNPEQLQEPDEQGNLPLSLAISSGKTWKGGIEVLMEGYPAAVGSQYTDERYYPVILSFLGQKNAFSSLYAVLREKPEIMKPPPEHERKRKREDLA